MMYEKVGGLNIPQKAAMQTCRKHMHPLAWLHKYQYEVTENTLTEHVHH